MSDYYVTVYLKAPAERSEVFDGIRQVVQGQVRGRTIETGHLTIDLCKNKLRRPGATEDQFLDWPYYLEIDPASDDAPLEQHVAALADLIQGLERKGWQCVAACDYEDELAAVLAASPKQTAK